MGPNQSKSTPGKSSADTAIKTSYYELLGVERQATDDEIKKAYRRRALDLHPDRNYGKEEDATQQFSEIQAAYEVLSDPQERAWYDSHESAILRGADGGDTEEHYEHDVRVTTAEEITAMMGKFNGRVDFSDSPSGFFGFLREVFETLSKEEEVAADWEGAEIPDYPTFGHKDDAYEDVVKGFYAAWGGFGTKKAFGWKDKYRYNEAPDRRMRRMMERENKGFRDQGIREFNEAVRALVSFVRKRDPRYTPNTQTEADRAKALREASAAQAAKARAANAAKMEDAVPEWTKVRDSDEVELSAEETEEDEEFECVSCRKTFKSEKQWEAHEKSKKHQKAVYALKKKMRKENAALGLDEEVIDSGVITPMDDDEEGEDEQDEVQNEDADVSKGVEDLDLEHTNNKDEDSDSQAPNTSKVSPKEEKLETDDTEGTSSGTSDDDYAPRSKIADRLTSTTTESDLSTPADPTLKGSTILDSPPTAEKKLGKAALKRLKKASKEPETPLLSTSGGDFQCVVCKEGFPSKTKLFDHIKKNPKHAAPVAIVKGGQGKGKGKKK